ncbi:hypothetical protein [Aestuariibaculum lutulentum]|uniref:Uncharacterized protein n=1 Tax=Aestuariibaculum lutulentum TaxID=2920935 RepID=A0ABS9RLM5_9FLAO|nr:hypothetical protein [Aestuariibaculum lutulentum]MCH4553436.1 hypothetical protein [Aestuariibaculum lutulentum]
MKKLPIIISSIFTLLTFNTFASNISQYPVDVNLVLIENDINSNDYFIGKWKVQVDGTPNGDVIMNLEIKKIDDKYVGSVQTDGSGPNPVKADKIEIKDNELKVYWLAGGYNVYLQLEKVKDNVITGSLMDMFDAKGERVVE